jgi:succinate dehydrogenase / fumarate reductase cytochrome b subunit
MSSTTHEAAPRPSARPFLAARLGSLLAIAPLGVWTVLHVWNNLAAFRGADAWEQAVTHHAHPAATAATAVVVLAPLAFHTVWGIGRLLTTRPNNARYRGWGNFKYLLQRISAVGVAAFLGAHLWLAYFRPRFVEGRPEPFADIAGEMRHHGPTLVVYVLGTLGVAYHLANGLHAAAMSWGLVATRRALGKLEWVVAIVFVALLAGGWGAIYALWAAG